MLPMILRPWGGRVVRFGVQRIILVTALVLGGLVDAFFALVNFYPVAPKPSRGPTRYVVAQMTETQGTWFQSHVLDEFDALHNVDLKLRRVELEEQILPTVKAAESQGNDVVLFVMPRNQGARAESQGLVGSFATAVHANFARDLAGVDSTLLTEAQVDGVQ